MSKNDDTAATALGEFRVMGEYFKDFFLLKHDGVYHLYYNVGTADDHSQQWTQPGNEKCFGHATSVDLRRWDVHPRILPVVPDTWESQVVSAPCIVRGRDRWQMVYTGFDDALSERIGLASSSDLFHWEREPRNPRYAGPAWTQWRPDGWADCRDPHLVEHQGSWFMYNCVLHKNGRGAVALARSHNLFEWEDLGPAVQTAPVPESPVVFERGGRWHMICSAGGAGAFHRRRARWPMGTHPDEVPRGLVCLGGSARNARRARTLRDRGVPLAAGRQLHPVLGVDL